MTQTEYEQKRAECWEEFLKNDNFTPHTSNQAFNFAFARAYALGKHEKNAEKSNTDGSVAISLHVAIIPCQEEFYMGVDASHEAYTIYIPKSMIPSNLLAVINGECKNKLVTNIAIMK